MISWLAPSADLRLVAVLLAALDFLRLYANSSSEVWPVACENARVLPVNRKLLEPYFS